MSERVYTIFTCLACGYREAFDDAGPCRCPYGCRRPDLLERHEYRFEPGEQLADVEKRPRRRLPAVRVPLRADEQIYWPSRVTRPQEVAA